MKNRIGREAAINAFLQSLTPFLGTSVRDMMRDPDFDLAAFTLEIYPRDMDALCSKADELTEALDEPSSWILVDLAIIGLGALVKRRIDHAAALGIDQDDE